MRMSAAILNISVMITIDTKLSVWMMLIAVTDVDFAGQAEVTFKRENIVFASNRGPQPINHISSSWFSDIMFKT